MGAAMVGIVPEDEGAMRARAVPTWSRRAASPDAPGPPDPLADAGGDATAAALRSPQTKDGREIDKPGRQEVAAGRSPCAVSGRGSDLVHRLGREA